MEKKKGEEEGDFGLVIWKTTTIQFGKSKEIRGRWRNTATNQGRISEIRQRQLIFPYIPHAVGSHSKAE